MAAKKPKSRKIFRQDKAPVYQSLYRMNEAFGVIERELGALQDSKVLPFEPVYHYRAEELRAGINHRLVDLLTDREVRDWAVWQKHRLTRERVLIRQKAKI
jgi:hypothetical protein